MQGVCTVWQTESVNWLYTETKWTSNYTTLPMLNGYMYGTVWHRVAEYGRVWLMHRGLWWSRAHACQAFLLLPLWTLRPFFAINHAALLRIQILYLLDHTWSTRCVFLSCWGHVDQELVRFPNPLALGTGLANTIVYHYTMYCMHVYNVCNIWYI